VHSLRSLSSVVASGNPDALALGAGEAFDARSCVSMDQGVRRSLKGAQKLKALVRESTDRVPRSNTGQPQRQGGA
jgi:hypothetical protein